MFSLSPLFFAFAPLFISSANATEQRSSLLARQTVPSIDASTIPTQCQSPCAAITSNNTCTTLGCICSASGVGAFTSCLRCLAEVVNNVAITTSAQNSINTLTDACNTAGMSVPKQTITASAALPHVHVGALLAGASTVLATGAMLL